MTDQSTSFKSSLRVCCRRPMLRPGWRVRRPASWIRASRLGEAFVECRCWPPLSIAGTDKSPVDIYSAFQSFIIGLCLFGAVIIRRMPSGSAQMAVRVVLKLKCVNTVSRILVILTCRVVIEHQPLNPLLLGSFGFLLVAHRDSEARVGGEVDVSCLWLQSAHS